MKSLSQQSFLALETRSTRLRYRPTVLSSAVSLLLLISWAADSQVAVADKAAAPNDVEEVTVYGEKSLLGLKRALIRAQDDAFDVFNSINTDNQYDIRCYKRAPLGSHIKHRICYANYVNDLENEAADVWRGSGKRIRLDRPPIVSVTKLMIKEKNLRAIMDKLKLEHPELAETLDAYSNAKHRYVTASEEK